MKKVIFLLILFIVISALMPRAFVFAQEEPEARLEIVYPSIPGVATPETVASGLPNYIRYIYYFSFAIIGIIILGALIYNGVVYLLSVGNPEKLTSARKGIVAAFLGAIILFSSFFIFRSINPELTLLRLPEIDILEPIVAPGIYICNYQVPDIFNVLRNYREGDEEEKIQAAEDLTRIMKNGDDVCLRVASSGNLRNAFEPSRPDGSMNHAMFAIPRKTYVYNPSTEQTEEVWEYDYGIVLHAKDGFRGKCQADIPYIDIDTYPLIDFKVRSITIYEKPEIEPGSENEGVILFQCLDYNESTLCPEGLTGILARRSFRSEGGGLGPAGTIWDYYRFVFRSELGVLASGEDERQWTHGTRSIKIDPQGSYFAVLYSADFERISGETGEAIEDDFICEIISANDNNLLDRPIGQCNGPGTLPCASIWANEVEEQLVRCHPCLETMTVIKGNVIY
jgi:hypothetical protein